MGAKVANDGNPNQTTQRVANLQPEPYGLKAFLLSVAVILPIIVVVEIYNSFLKGRGIWRDSWALTDGKPRSFWCEALNADLDAFIIEPVNARTNYAFALAGTFMIVLGFFDLHYGTTTTAKDNPIMRFPIITIVNGVAASALSVGSFLYHSCECYKGSILDIAGMMAATAFPAIYTPLQLIRRMQTWWGAVICASFQVAVWVGYFLIYFRREATVIKARASRDMTVLFAIDIVAVSTMLLIRWCKKLNRKHTFVYWTLVGTVISLALGKLFWEMEVNDIIACRPRSLWQGHAFWHFMTCISLCCIYAFYRLETITVSEPKPAGSTSNDGQSSPV